MIVTIKNCNNIKEGNINIIPNKLNIKYGINGTGKSTISKAIIKNIYGETLDDLKPFNGDESVIPSIIGCDNFKSVKIYNDDYVSQYLFLPNGDNLHKDSFEVFIKPENYESQIEAINSILSTVKQYVSENSIINSLISQRNELNKILKLNAKRTSINASGLGKALVTGNKIINIPQELAEFSALLNSKEKVKWYSWQNTGREYQVENKCPFCAKKLEDEFETKMKILDNLFDKKNVESLSKMESIFGSISNLVSKDTNKFISEVLKDENPISNENKEAIAKLVVEIDSICCKLLFFAQLDYSNLKDINNLEAVLSSSRFNVDEYKYICGEEFLTIINELNCAIDEMHSNIQSLRENISILNTSIKTSANKNKQRINDFLDTVGMNYEVKVENNKLLLLYKGSEIIVDVNSHLSWGEKNAFALSLFLFDCKHENPDLIILDDPVSSFDFNKKYAITHYLFNQRNSLQGKTILMLTHDLEPIINLVKIKNFEFVSSFYIENSNGIVTENAILKDDINSILNVTKSNYENTSINIINRLIHLRRYLELNNEYSFEYNMISALLKGRRYPNYINSKIDRPFIEEEFINAEKQIQQFITDFNYKKIQKNINDRLYMKNLYLNTTNNYEKIEIFRIILKTFGLLNINPVLEKFINEEFHIENTYVFQLDPYAYNLVPNYIVEICDNAINRMRTDDSSANN